MKKLLVIFCLLAIAPYTFANKIDNIKTDSDAIKFLVGLKDFKHYNGLITIPSVNTIITAHTCDTLVKTWGIKNWQKLDLNNDKRTDLLAIVCQFGEYNSWIAIDRGNNTFKLIRLGYNSINKCELINPIIYNNQSLIVFHSYRDEKKNWRSVIRVPRTDTLIYKFDNFVEYNKEPADYKIDSIEFSRPGFSLASGYGLTINHLGNATCTITNDGTKTTYSGLLKEKDLEEIYNLVEFLNVKKLANNWSDDISCQTNIMFSDGTTKNIGDYGQQGTFGLKALYDKLFALTGKEHWKKITYAQRPYVRY